MEQLTTQSVNIFVNNIVHTFDNGGSTNVFVSRSCHVLEL